MKKIAIFYGTRPEYLKLKNIIKLIPANKRDVIFIGQHNSLVQDNFYNKKININNKDKSTSRLSSIVSQIIKKVNLKKYDSVIIQGDTATTFSIAIAAFNLNKKII
jgi:UDP-N-acetylglucosamine 2-epimerase